VPATQHITASITISGQQDIAITSHDRGTGSYISVITGLVMVTMFDIAAARTYTGAWLAPHILDFAQLLPSDGTTQWRNQRDAESVRLIPTAADGPALSVEAHGSDDVKRNFARDRQVMLVKVGGILWTVADVEAYRSMTEAYTRVAQLAEVVLRTAKPPPGNRHSRVPASPQKRAPGLDRRPVEKRGGRAGLPTAVSAPSPGRRAAAPRRGHLPAVVHTPAK